MVASLLAKTPSTVLNAPRLGDVDITAGMLRSIGAGVDIDGNSVTIDPASASEPRIPVSYSGLNRVPILMVGPLLHRIGEAFVPLVGGDRIGTRPVDYHVGALRQFGAEVEVTADGLEAKALRLKGAHFALPFPSVGRHRDGAAHRGGGRGPHDPRERRGRARGGRAGPVPPAHGRPHRAAARPAVRDRGRPRAVRGHPAPRAATASRPSPTWWRGWRRAAGCASPAAPRTASSPPSPRSSAWAPPSRSTTTPSPPRRRPIRPAAVRTSPHPGFMTDWQPPLMVLCTRAHGMSVIHETVFEDRLGYVDALMSMDAEVELFEQCLVGDACRFQESGSSHSALIRGISVLRGAEVTMPDVRGAFSYVIAAAAGRGAVGAPRRPPPGAGLRQSPGQVRRAGPEDHRQLSV